MKNQQAAPNTIASHLNELRVRLFWCALVFVFFTGVGYMLHDSLLEILQRPLGSTLYYTSPTGGFDFIFKISIVFGLLFSMPVMLYQAMKFTKPAYDLPRKLIVIYGLGSLVLACLGASFAYFISLPASLNFLTKFGGESITPIITAQEYFNFALSYVGGFAALFQLILIIAIINRIKPLNPLKMLKLQRYLIVGSFIVAAILTPTPDPINQAIMAVPIILMYQVGIIYVWLKNMKLRKRGRIAYQDIAQGHKRSFRMPLQSLVEIARIIPTQAVIELQSHGRVIQSKSLHRSTRVASIDGIVRHRQRVATRSHYTGAKQQRTPVMSTNRPMDRRRYRPLQMDFVQPSQPSFA